MSETDLEVEALAQAIRAGAYDAVGSAEWTAWAARDVDAASRRRTEVEGVADEAARRIVSGICGAR